MSTVAPPAGCPASAIPSTIEVTVLVTDWSSWSDPDAKGARSPPSANGPSRVDTTWLCRTTVTLSIGSPAG